MNLAGSSYERIPEVGEEESARLRSRQQRLMQGVGLTAGLVLIALFGTVLTTNSTPSGHTTLSPLEPATGTVTSLRTERAAGTEEEPLMFAATNAYTDTSKPYERNTYTAYPHLGDMQVVEPHVTTTFVAMNSISGADYVWKINDEVVESVEGHPDRVESAFAFNDETKDTHTVELIEMDADGTVRRSVKEQVKVHYVRRELRQLTDEDREKFLDALYYIMVTPEDEAKETYGETYTSMATMHIMHNDYAGGDVECDHLHNGPSFLPAHEAITMLFGENLQLIHPGLAAPYWDYFIEAVEIETNNWPLDKFYESPILGEDYFGSTNPEDNSIMGSRFDKLPVYTTAEYEGRSIRAENGYGQARARWNQNPSPYVTRYRTRCGTQTLDWIDYSSEFEGMSTCANLRKLFDRDTFQSFLNDLALDVHGSVHIAMGGMSGACDAWDSQLQDFLSPFESAVVCGGGSVNLKSLWREGVITFDDECKDINCGYSCDTDAMSMRDIGVVFAQHVRNSPTDHTGLTDEEYEKVGEIACSSGVFVGDMYSSSATADPLFWVIHTLSDRMVHYKMLMDNDAGVQLDTTLDPDDADCSYQLPTAEVPFDLSKITSKESFTNQELLDAVLPTNGDTYIGKHIYADFNFGGAGTNCLTG